MLFFKAYPVEMLRSNVFERSIYERRGLMVDAIDSVLERQRVTRLRDHLTWELNYDSSELLHAEFDCDICATLINYVRNFEKAYKSATGESRTFEEIVDKSEESAV